jgi:copper chaperone CopZ
MFKLAHDRAKACRIVHELPGRVRISCPGLRYLSKEADAISGKLAEVGAVRSVQVNVATENVLVHFEPAQAATQDILLAAQSALNEHSLAVFKAERTLAARPTVQERRLQEESAGEILTRVLASVITLGFSALSTRAAPVTLLGRFMTIPALTSLSLAQRLELADPERPTQCRYPQFHRHYRESVVRTGPCRPDDHRPGRPGRTAHGLHDGSHAPRHSRHARRGRRSGLAT